MRLAVDAGRGWRRRYSLGTLKLRLNLVAFLFLASSACHAQTEFTRISGAEDQAVPAPALVGTLGQQDAAALQEMIDYLKSVNISAWKGMQASGTLTDTSGHSSQATLTILNEDHFRLDVQAESGQRSVRTSGSYGETKEADGKTFVMPSATAKIGLLAFPRLLVSTFPAANTSLIDRGQVQIDGKPLHRVTVEEAVFPDDTTFDQRNIAVIDLYFDPASHLLLKSASAVQLDSSDRERYLVVVTYGDYQAAQGSLLPLSISQSLNGQPQWNLQLNNPNLQPAVDTSYFRF